MATCALLVWAAESTLRLLVLEVVFVGKLLVAVVVTLDFETGVVLVAEAVETVVAELSAAGGGNGCGAAAPAPANTPLVVPFPPEETA